MSKKFDCAIIGDWHLAFVAAGVLSSLNYKVVLVNHKSLNPWTEFPEIPVYEPGLKELFDDGISSKRLDFSNSISDGWTSDLIWMAIDTPVNDRDEADTRPLVEVAQLVKKHHPRVKAFITNSQIPLGFSHKIEKEIGLPTVYIPENLRLGKGIETFLRADRTVIGASTFDLAQDVQKFLSGFQTQFLICNLQTAEMVKHANNAFLAMSISYANELARLGERFDVDGQTVAQALKMDKRIGPMAYVAPGLGFAGGTLPRDLRTLLDLGQKQGIPMRIMQSVIDVNEDTTEAVCEILRNTTREIKKPKILIMGYTYKADTDTLRRSLSLDIAKKMDPNRFELFGFDPMMNSRDLSELKKSIKHMDSLENLPTKPDVALVMTARPAFKALPWKQLRDQWNVSAMNSCLVLDTQNVLPEDQVLNAGFDFKKLWSPLKRNQLGQGSFL
jgi:UDPglucose 6-dehydrogenase